ncbi:MAG: Ig-like domain-containing protein [Nitrospirota bacterium]
MKKGKLIIVAVLIVGVLYACLNTITTPRTSTVTVNVQAAGKTAALTVEPATLAYRMARVASAFLAPPPASAYIPSIVSNVRLTVTATDMTSIERTEAAAGLDSVSITVDVPIGAQRNFLVQGLSAASSVVFSGQVVVDLTGAPLDIPIVMTPGTSSIPQVTATAPADGATGVVYRPVITATFSETMDPSTITATTFSVVETASGITVTGTVSAAGTTATFTLSADLVPNTDYTVMLTTGARSAYGIPLARSFVWLFTTAPTIPSVTATSPADGGTGVPLNAVITAAFSEAMDPATIAAASFTVSGITGTVTYNTPGRTATFAPAGPLASSATYTATITTAARSTNNVPLAQDHLWSFTTGTATDTVPPVFAGIDSIARVTLTSSQLAWFAATDDMTPVSNIVYLVSQSTTSGAFAPEPTVITAPGATSHLATGLVPGVIYYFKVNARDEAGNVDTNTRQLWSVAPGYYVDANTGSDGNSGSEASPYKTITKVLSVITMSNTNVLGVYAAAGMYDLPANGEVFPLQLTPYTTVYCRGAANSTIIDATGSGADAIYGNVNAGIDGCTVIPAAAKTGIDDRVSGPGGTPSQITVSSSVIDGPALDAVTLSANSSVATSTISGAGIRGIVISAGRPSVIGNRISGKQTGIEVDADTDPSIDGNTLENNGVGIIVTAAGGRPSVRNNTIANNIKGILVSAGAPLIHKNEVKTNFIAGNDVGIEIAGGMPTVSFNTVTSNDVGISVTGGTPSVKSNSIFCNAIVDLEVLVNSQIDARKNAWDHAPPSMDLAPCLGADVCYSFDVTGIPIIDPYSVPAAGACP